MQGQGRRVITTARCFNCSEMGHYEMNCKKPLVSASARRARDILKERDVCYRCGQRGHWQDVCKNPPKAASTCEWEPN